jgi:hypothetical protein
MQLPHSYDSFLNTKKMSSSSYDECKQQNEGRKREAKKLKATNFITKMSKSVHTMEEWKRTFWQSRKLVLRHPTNN